MLFHLIWGEAANLRLVPEFLCFLLFACGTALRHPSADEAAPNPNPNPDPDPDPDPDPNPKPEP